MDSLYQLVTLGAFWALLVSPWLYTLAIDLINLYAESRHDDHEQV